jgi:hypothetical protein
VAYLRQKLKYITNTWKHKDKTDNNLTRIAQRKCILHNVDIKDNNCIDYLFRVFRNPFPNIIFDRTTSKEIEKIIKSLKSKYSYGYDEISIKIVKISSPFITAPLTYICNRPILSGSFPTRLKYSVIKPLLKKVTKIYKKIIGLYRY